MTKPPPRSPSRKTSASPGAPSGKTAEVERALALRDVMDHAVRVHQEISEAKPFPRRSRVLVATIVCIPLLAFSVYSVVARPEFIWGSRSVLPPDQADANARVALFMLAQRIEGVRAQRGAPRLVDLAQALRMPISGG